MNNVDKQYLDLMKDILDNGVRKQTRSGEVLSVFGRMMRFNLKDGLPILTTKKVFSRGCIEELLWFLKGSTNIKYLVDRNVNIWNDDAYRHYVDVITDHNEIVEKYTKNRKVPKTREEYLYFTTYPVYTKDVFLDYVKKGMTIKVISKNEKVLTDCLYDELIVNYTFGDLGDVYGKQWRRFGVSGRDQIADVINKLKTNPDDRRLLVVAFNPDVLDSVALPPCHILFQFYTKPLENGKRELSCCWTQRSVDLPLGWALNVLSYSILTHMIAQCCDMEVGEILCSLGDVHIYANQIDGVKEQLTRDPYKYDLPKIELNPDIKNIDDFTIDDIKIVGYESYPKIYFPLSVG